MAKLTLMFPVMASMQQTYKLAGFRVVFSDSCTIPGSAIAPDPDVSGRRFIQRFSLRNERIRARASQASDCPQVVCGAVTRRSFAFFCLAKLAITPVTLRLASPTTIPHGVGGGPGPSEGPRSPYPALHPKYTKRPQTPRRPPKTTRLRRSCEGARQVGGNSKPRVGGKLTNRRPTGRNSRRIRQAKQAASQATVISPPPLKPPRSDHHSAHKLTSLHWASASVEKRGRNGTTATKVAKTYQTAPDKKLCQI